MPASRRRPWGLRAGWAYLAFVVACFVLAALSFVGAGVVANRNLHEVTRLAHDVSENAMGPAP